ncbi:MAG: PfkB family carbohydrate kinase [Patescibacteria group bacterium]
MLKNKTASSAGIRQYCGTKVKTLKIMTVGGATQDIFFETGDAVIVNNRDDIIRQKLVGFEYGAKINIPEAYFCFGGGASNSAVAFSRLGVKTTSYISVGEDKTGESICNNLKNERIDVSCVEFSKKPSGFSCAVVYGRKTKDHVLFTYRGANEDLQIDVDNIIKAKPDLVYLSSLSGKKWVGILNKLSALVLKNNIKLAWNPGNLQLKKGIGELKVFLHHTEVLILNKDEAIELLLSASQEKIINPRFMLRALKEYCSNIIVITDGQKGAYAIDENRRIYFQPVKKIEKYDTTGVGDAFGSTFVWGLNFFHNDIKAALEVATINASAVIRQLGAQKGLLTKNQMMREL